MNTVVRALLRTPGLQRWLGRAFAVITVTGAKTGIRYSTPVQYMTIGGHHVVLSQTHRRWWRNLRANPDIELLLAGRRVTGRATIAEGDGARELLSASLVGNPGVARFYGQRPDSTGAFATADLDRLLERVVVIDVTPVS
jgi:deazaflavin-dependent oxidoreductase (nitroreductase family)